MDRVLIGTIVNTHGLKGTLKVKSQTDFIDERYAPGTTLHVAFRGEMIPLTVQSVRSVKGLLHVAFREFTDINQVERYKGADLYIDASNIHELDDEDEFYFDELIGLDVYTDQWIGTCVDVRQLPQGELLVVRRDDAKDALIPFNKVFVKAVDKDMGRILLDAWEGLL